MKNELRYYPLSAWLKERFGCRVFKVSLDGGFTCPNRDGAKGTGGCIYCETATLVPSAYAGDGAAIEEQLEAGIERMKRRYRADKVIAYFQMNSSTYAPVDALKKIYAPALDHPDVAGVAVSTRPDCVDQEVVELFGEMKRSRELWVELGLQSASDETLKAINRGHGVGEFTEAVERLGAAGVDVCAHIIIGLPGEGRKEVLKTAEFLSDLGVWGVKLHQLQVIKDTPLEEAFDRGAVRTLSLDEYASLVVEFLERTRPETVIHRLSGDAPERFIRAPRWGANKFQIRERVLEEMAERSSSQGAKCRKTW